MIYLLDIRLKATAIPQLHAHSSTCFLAHERIHYPRARYRHLFYRDYRDPERAVMRNRILNFTVYRYVLRQIFNSRECTVQISFYIV